MPLVDLSHPLVHGQANFPSDPKLSIVPHGTTATLRYNISQVVMSTHQGTHLDAMYHFVDEGKTLDQMPLDWFYGPATVLRIPKAPQEEITADDFRRHESVLVPGAKIIYETGWHRHGWLYVVVPVTDGTLLLELPGGQTASATLTAGLAYTRDAGVEHNVVNAGTAPLSFIETEVKGLPG
jgi:mannose-6-phosphate isomerase-like protein (cupin superfamily)